MPTAVESKKSPSYLAGILRSLVHSDDLPEYRKKGSLKRRLIKWLSLSRHYSLSYRLSRQSAGIFQELETYCVLVGSPRSGGSTLSALLDAHPNVIFTDEVDILKYISAGFTRDQIFHLLLTISQKQAILGRKDAGKFAYRIPGQWQGRFSRLRVLGDSKAGKSARRFAQDPDLLCRLREFLQVQLRIFHVLRNPFDTITAMHLRSGRPLAEGIDYFFENCSTVLHLRKQTHPFHFMTVRQEDLFHDPSSRIIAVCRFLGLEASQDYLQACSSMLYRPPTKIRSLVQWTPDLINLVMRKIEPFDFLQGYSFQD